MLKLLMRILFDQKGTWAAVAIGGGVALGGTVLGATAGKNKQSVYDPYPDLRAKFASGPGGGYLGGKLGTQTPYNYNDKFTLDTPPELSAASNTVLGKLGNMPQTETDLFGVYDKYAKARQASAQEQQNKDLIEQKNMYNRLGLSSSTPYLTDSAELRRKQGIDMDLTNADIARQGVDATRQAYETNNNIARGWVADANSIAQIKQEAQKYGINMSEADIQRMVQEEQQWSAQAEALLGANPPQVSYTPNFAAQLGKTLTGVGTGIATAGAMGGFGGGGTAFSPGGAGFSNTAPFNPANMAILR